MLSSTSSLFPDEEHAYEPRRHVRFAALSRNALPNVEPGASPCRKKKPPSHRKAVPPPSSGQNSIPTSPAVQALRKIIKLSTSPKNLPKSVVKHPERVKYDEDPGSRALWGFPVRFSPKKQLQAEWRAAEEKMRRDLQDQQEKPTSPLTSVGPTKQETKANEADYTQIAWEGLHVAGGEECTSIAALGSTEGCCLTEVLD
ncbi:hypothetical protein V7S43_004011 [Phytophthora oleae]|uniref:Uncharacterized protein n=1 Tax=Phytophthora oleae TaxID=2107226 RepID=A0ABD3FYJ9_9STRA